MGLSPSSILVAPKIPNKPSGSTYFARLLQMFACKILQNLGTSPKKHHVFRDVFRRRYSFVHCHVPIQVETIVERRKALAEPLEEKTRNLEVKKFE